MSRAQPGAAGTVVPGTYGSILETVRHVVGSDSWDLFVASDERTSHIDEERMNVAELRVTMEGHGGAWSSLLATEPDPDAILREVDEDDGYTRDIPMGIQQAQALHHGTDHRSQVCTALTSLGLEPPAIDVLDFGIERGRVVEVTAS